MSETKTAEELHESVPPDWYYSSIKKNPFQKFWHTRRFEEISKLIEPVKGKVLDIGSADGIFTKVILDKTKAKGIIGIDVLKSSVEWANKHWKKSKKMTFQTGNAHFLDFKKNTFDAVFALEVLEHVHKPQDVFKQIKKVLKKGGYTIVLVPTDNYLFRVIWFLWTKLGRGKIWDHCHIQSFSDKNTLAENLKHAGFAIEEDKKFLLGMLNVVKARKK